MGTPQVPTTIVQAEDQTPPVADRLAVDAAQTRSDAAATVDHSAGHDSDVAMDAGNSQAQFYAFTPCRLDTFL